MKKIAKYVATDGSEFTSKKKCSEYEAHCKDVKRIMRRLGAIPKLPGCEFTNGGGYRQHDKSNFLFVRKSILELAKKYTDHKWIQQTIDDITVHPSYAARIISECTTSPLDKAWSRIQCVDKQYREWGQPYYAEHPEKAKQVQLD